MIKQRLSTPTPGERCAYPQNLVVKRAALLFDRIYCDPSQHLDNNIPSNLQFDIPNIRSHYNKAQKMLQKEVYKKNVIEKKIPSIYDLLNVAYECALWARVESFWLAGYAVTPVYNYQKSFLLDYPSGNNIAYQAALENLPEIIEDQVSWDQVIEFRSDKDAIRKYRELRLWLEYSISAQSIEHARDLIAQKIEDYEWAIRKHGLKTATGALSSILSLKGLISLTAGVGLGAVIGGPVWSALTGATFTVGRASVWVAERMIERQDILRGPDAAVALIYDAKKLVR